MSTEGIRLFQKIIVGVFHNQQQVDEEIQAGKQLHPFAKHVTEVIDHRITNVPENFTGTFVLEESYYTYPDGRYEIKPLFFKITPEGEFDILLESVAIPEDLKKEDVVNSNPDLNFNYNNLQTKDAFGKAHYHNIGGKFLVNHDCDFGGGMRFNLSEVLTENSLTVMELLKKDGHQITSYNTPIKYLRQ